MPVNKEFQEWIETRKAELKYLSLVGPTEADRILADKIYDILGMVLQECERIHNG